MREKVRADERVVELGLAENAAEAEAMIRLGRVVVAGELVIKPGAQVARTSRVEIKPGRKYVSRGGIKLESAIENFKISVQGKVCLDVGASTGGFTDFLLQNAPKKVYALDVGKGLIDWKLRKDPRVVVIEGVNARFISPEIIPEQIEIAVIDVSFISLEAILPSLKTVLAAEAEVIALVKPQFELEPKLAPKGVVRDESLQLKAVEKIEKFAQKIGFKTLGQTRAKIKGPKGNQEYFLHLRLKNDECN